MLVPHAGHFGERCAYRFENAQRNACHRKGLPQAMQGVLYTQTAAAIQTAAASSRPRGDICAGKCSEASTRTSDATNATTAPTVRRDSTCRVVRVLTVIDLRPG